MSQNLGSSKKLPVSEKDTDVFTNTVLTKQSKQSKEKLFSQSSNEGLEPPRLSTSINYEKSTFDMAILQLKVDKTGG